MIPEVNTISRKASLARVNEAGGSREGETPRQGF